MYYVQAKNIDDAFDSCNEVLAAEPDNIDALCHRAETYINNEQYEEGTSYIDINSVLSSPTVCHLSSELLDICCCVFTVNLFCLKKVNWCWAVCVMPAVMCHILFYQMSYCRSFW